MLLVPTYRANAIPALRWVYATLIETALVAYELVLPPLTAQQRDRYYRESQLFVSIRHSTGMFAAGLDCICKLLLGNAALRNFERQPASSHDGAAPYCRC